MRKALEECRMDTMNDWASIKSGDQERHLRFPLQENQAQPHDPACHHGGVSQKGYDREGHIPF